MLPRELRQYSNRSVFITLGAIIGLAFITTAATVLGLSALLIYRQGAQNYNDSRVELEMLVADAQRAASLSREYLLTGNQSDLEAYRQHIAAIPGRLEAVEQDTAPAAVMPQVGKLRPLVNQFLNEQDRVLALYRSGDAAGAIAALDTGTETSLLSQLVVQAGAIQEGDIAQLSTDRTRINTLAEASRDISLVSLVITLVLAVVAYYLYLRGIQSERRLDRAKDEFVSLASHQLRTPATGVKSILATLVAGDLGPLSPRQLHFAQKALDSNERGLAVIEELLNVAKADAGRLVLNLTSFDAADLVRAVITDQQASIADKQLTLNVLLPKSAAPLKADHEKLYMALGNLLDNARKYTPAGGTIDVVLAARRQSVRVSIADTGIGIAKAELAHIFDRFARASAAEAAHVEGTGLGLYLVSQIVELHGGHISVNSKIGNGTKFVMIIPKRKPQM